MNTIIISDTHIGSRYFLCEHFKRFVKSFSQDHEFILNGDIIDNPYGPLSPAHQEILELIRKVSTRTKMVWVRGNHDNGYRPPGFEHVEFTPLYGIQHRLLIAHGYDFDEIMPRNRAFMKAFKLMHGLRIKLGARPVPVAAYAKKWKRFYRVLRYNVMQNAVNCAWENGYGAVVCGHTHYAEEAVIHGVHYYNTGTWTERPIFYLLVTPETITLNQF